MFGELPDWYIEFRELEQIAERLRCSVIEAGRHPQWVALARAAARGEVGFEDRKRHGGERG